MDELENCKCRSGIVLPYTAENGQDLGVVATVGQPEEKTGDDSEPTIGI